MAAAVLCMGAAVFFYGLRKQRAAEDFGCFGEGYEGNPAGYQCDP